MLDNNYIHDKRALYLKKIYIYIYLRKTPRNDQSEVIKANLPQ